MNTFMQVKKAVIPAAGFGTRFLPFTKAVPKELIPLIDKPVIQYVVEEAEEAGITDILIILSSGKEAIIRHFDRAEGLENRLEHDGKLDFLECIRSVGSKVKIHYVYQKVLNGLGGAVAECESFVAGEPFAVLLGDTVMSSKDGSSVTASLLDVYKKTGGSVVALEEVKPEFVKKYGVLGGKEIEPGVFKADTIVEKPNPEEAPSNLAVAARYVLTPAIFDLLRKTPKGKGGEIQLTDAMRLGLSCGVPLYGCKSSCKRHDMGNKLSFLKNTVEFALKRSEFRDDFLKYLQDVVAQESIKQK